MRITVVASMRNEGPFIVEWVAWYRMLGFTDVVVVTNNCTDHSPELLDALQAAGWLVHLRHDVEPGQRITRAKLKTAAAHRAVRRAHWVMVCDVDEFLVVHRGAGRIGDLIDVSADPAYLGMSINWRVFGSSGLTTFEDRPVHQQFLYANPRTAPQSRFVKSIFRQPRLFAQIGEHSPTGFDFAAAGRPWHSKGMTWVNAAGRPVPRWRPAETFLSRLPEKLVGYQVAQINHYMVRSEESFSLKRGTKSPVALSNRYRRGYLDSANAGDEVDASAFHQAEAFEAVQAQAMALPGVARLHALCCADHVRAICEKAGRDWATDARHQAFLDRANVLT